MSSEREPPPDDTFEDEEKDDLFISTKENLSEENFGEQTQAEEKPSGDISRGYSAVEEVSEQLDSEKDAEEGNNHNDDDDDDEDDDENLFKDDEKEPAASSSMSEVNLEKTPEVPEKVISAKESYTAGEEESEVLNMEEEKDEVHDLHISVSDPHKIGDGMSSYMTYKVRTKTTMPIFKRSELTVDRRFSDFLGLHEKLVTKHRHIGRIVPPAPEKNFVGMTKIKMSKSEEDAQQIDFVERRAAALERYLNRVARHRTLIQDPDFRDFLEQEELPQATSTRALSSAGVIRFMKNMEGAINKITIKMTEEDAWFEEKTHQIEKLDQKLRLLHHAVEDLVRHRKELASNTASFGKSAATLGNSEEHTALSRALAQLSEAFEKVEGLHQEVANSDFYNVSEEIGDYVRMIGEIKEVLQVRIKSWHNWQTAEQSLVKKKDLETKLQQQSRTDKLPNVQSEIKELENRVKLCKKEFEDLSSSIKREITKFEHNRIVDFKQIILTFLKMLVKSQEQNIKFWEAFLPEAKAIA